MNTKKTTDYKDPKILWSNNKIIIKKQEKPIKKSNNFINYK